MSSNPVEQYLKDLSEIRRTGGGVAEESYYGPLENLLNEIGRKLKPRVRCVGQLKNIGAGEPDFGLYTANQFQRANDAHPMEGQKPERGVIECKPWNDDSFARTGSTQVSNYWKKYNLVLVTNYRDFVLIGRDDRGKSIQLESFRMAESENAFVAMLAQPHKAAQEHGERLIECLRRTMLHAAPLTDPQDLAWFLASYAREARARVEQTRELPALDGLRKGLEEALGMKFEGDKGQHFFLATLVQTLFYGVFSSWVLWCRENWSRPDAKFQWHDAAWTLHVPMIASLFDQIATPQRLKPLGIDEVLDKAAIVLNRVDRPVFFSKFEQEHAVQYFYEPFLKAYDPELRKELGVWYTPPEVVQYQVERVDRVLREELNVADGLADEQVVILDPCCGTGAYLVETLKRIHKTLDEKGRSALTAQKLKKAAMDRVFGFEILPAPFVISHLQIGLVLRLLGAPFNLETNERAGVYLTNALTGWEPPTEPKKQLPLFPEMMQERDAADEVKREKRILVVIGNPPYNAFAGVSPAEEQGLVEVYKGVYYTERKSREGAPRQIRHYRLSDPTDRQGWGIRKFNLDELYVRFFRLAERRIADMTGMGVISFISNFSYLGDPSFVIMRERLLSEFDKIWLDCMNGDSRETGKLTPDGKPDPSVFSTEYNREGIRLGTAVSIIVRKGVRQQKAVVYFRQFWGLNKRGELLSSLEAEGGLNPYSVAYPSRENRYSFCPQEAGGDYSKWPRLVEFAQEGPYQGLAEDRRKALFDIDLDALRARMQRYYDQSVTWRQLLAEGGALTDSYVDFAPEETRAKALRTETFREDRLLRYSVRPFDTQFCYYTMSRPIWRRHRPEYFAQTWTGNSFVTSRFNCSKHPEGVPFGFVRGLCDYHYLAPNVGAIPVLIRGVVPGTDPRQGSLYGASANLCDSARAYLDGLGINDPDGDAKTAASIWMHAMAIAYSPTYLSENADGVRRDWPRIPLPRAKKAFQASAALGRRIAALLDTEEGVEGVTTGRIDPRLKGVGVIEKVGAGGLNPDEGHLEVTAGWGYAGKGGVCMPGTGKHETRGQRDARLKAAFGEETLDIYLNETAYWSNVPKCVWDYHIGGYQVIKKWLSYREKAILRRGLRVEEAEYVTEMAQRIAALILMQPDLDANYEAVKADTWPWPRSEQSTE
jgi:hypothetical protein